MTDKVPFEGPVTYRLVMYRPIVLTILVGLGLVGVVVVWNVPSANGPLAAFIALWLAILGWNAYWFLVRIAYEIGIADGSILRWRSITTSREVPLARVKRIRTFFPRMGAGTKEIVVDGDISPLISVTPGFSEVAAMFAQFRPDLQIQINWSDRLLERFGRKTVRWIRQ